ncbi:hypothetical protein GWK47_010194 [Chionoecetes opilio]|uniref:Uncharacterized protein n=1 Tax=Chionoecetes opilio TaxID=41210 RepID=A0A8J4XYR0_CHIOP|nr:hypothetical protein GWK47_010194 [Chionoecetes opilio]
MAESEVLVELRQLRAQVRDLTEARRSHDDVVRDPQDGEAQTTTGELRCSNNASPSTSVEGRRVETRVRNKETGRGRPQTPPTETRNSFAILAD